MNQPGEDEYRRDGGGGRRSDDVYTYVGLLSKGKGGDDDDGVGFVVLEPRTPIWTGPVV